MPGERKTAKSGGVRMDLTMGKNGHASRSATTYCRLLAVAVVGLVIMAVGCGGGSMSSTTGPMSAAQAQAVSGQVVQALSAALGNAFNGVSLDEKPRNLAAALANVHPETSSSNDCTSSGSGTTCNVPISYSGPCSAGGTIGISGDISGSLNNSGTGDFSTQIMVTPTNCVVAGTTFNGDPSITIGGQISLADSNISYPVNFTETGGISYGPNPSGSCTVNVKYSFSSTSACTVTGTVCGQSVNGTC
jgi:hypothetical protein